MTNLKLDLGAGPISPAGFTPRGNINGTAIYPLSDIADGAASVVRASHVLEHFAHAEIATVLAEWVRVLAPGGILRIAVPDFRKVAEQYLSGKAIPTEGYVMGGQVDAADFHKAIFDEEHLKAALASAGMVLLRAWKSEIADCALLPISLNIEGTKPAQSQPKIKAVMTTPRLGFNDMWNSAITALPRLGIDFTNVTGAFWDQSLTLVMDRAIEDGEADYLLALDYDSVFTAGHVARLIELAMVHPEADAIAPIQASRHADQPLFGLSSETRTIRDDGKSVDVDRCEFEVDLVKVRQAHFGLTLIKVSALKALPKPWFVGTPNAEGEWKEGKLDPDIHFWRLWEREGRNLHLASRVVIGHLELMVRWPDQNMDPVWQSAKDWSAANKAPAGVWTGVAE
jgi:hypothetical protein